MKDITKLLIMSSIAVGSVLAAEDRDIATEKFHELDTDGNEHISHQEVIDTEFIDLFSEMDRNSDGRVSLREYKSYKLQNPGPLDPSNLDSDITEGDELPKAPTSFNE